MSSFEPPTARRFALRQLALMQEQGLSQRKAYDIVSGPPGPVRPVLDAACPAGAAPLWSGVPVGRERNAALTWLQCVACLLAGPRGALDAEKLIGVRTFWGVQTILATPGLPAGGG